MAPRSCWKGFLRLSLVAVPVKAYSASTSGGGEIHLHQLHAHCHRRIRYHKVCPLHGEVQNDAIVSGYEYTQDQYVVVDPAELDQLRNAADHAVTIAEFIAPAGLDVGQEAGQRSRHPNSHANESSLEPEFGHRRRHRAVRGPAPTAPPVSPAHGMTASGFERSIDSALQPICSTS